MAGVPNFLGKVEDGKYTMGNYIINLESKVISEGDSWRILNALDLFSRKSSLKWLARSLNLTTRAMRRVLKRLPLLAEITGARDAKIDGNQNHREVTSQLLDISVRGHALSVDKSKKKCIVYIHNKIDLQFLVQEIHTDLLVMESQEEPEVEPRGPPKRKRADKGCLTTQSILDELNQEQDEEPNIADMKDTDSGTLELPQVQSEDCV